MANDRVERQLESLKRLRAAGPSADALAALRKALADRVNAVVAKAAAIAGEWQAHELMPDLRAAFERLFDKGTQSDPQCWGKNALAKALKDLGLAESAPFLRGLRHVQWEPVWGGQTDTAGVLRGTCALALVQCADLPRDETLRRLIEAVTEREAKVRADAARALEQMAGREAILLLRLKARAGDEDPRVTGQVLEALLQLEGAHGVPFVAAFLEGQTEEVGEEAALALGTCRLPEGVEALQGFWPKARGREASAMVLRAISAARLDPALDFLLELVRKGRRREAEDAMEALELHRESEEIVKRVGEAVAGRGEEELRALFAVRFGAKK